MGRRGRALVGLHLACAAVAAPARAEEEAPAALVALLAADPDLTWPTFLQRLERNYRFHAEERDARLKQLADIQTQMKPLP